MNATTNYDHSSTGFDCELLVMLDCDQATSEFSDMMHIHQHDGYRTTAVFEYLDCCDSDHADSVEDLFEFDESITPREFRRALFNVHMQCDSYTTWKPTARNFFDEFGVGNVDWREAFMEQLGNDFSIPEYAKEESFPLIDELPADKVKHKYRVKSTQGYSQGDYALVLIPNDHGWDGEHKDSIDEAVDHICWDQPIYARLEITEQETGEEDEIYLTEFLDSYYDWDRDKIIEGLKKLGTDEQGESVTRNQPLPQSVIDWVEEHLPEYPTP